jgi:hypothetical protein
MIVMFPSGNRMGPALRKPRPKWRNAAVCAGCLLLAGVARPEAGINGPETNIDRLAVAADSASAAFCRRCGLDRGDTLRLSLRADSADSRGQFVMSRWILGLDRRAVRVIRSNDPSSAWSVIPSEADVRYASGGRRGFFRSIFLRRTASVGLTWSRPVPDGEIRADTLSVACVDEIPRSGLESVERGGLLLGRPVRPDAGFRIRILETAVAAAVTGWTVYAFFSIRSH